MKALLQNAICWAVRPYILRELPGWGRLYDATVGSWQRDWLWKGARRQTIKGKLHGFTMQLDLQKWSERATFFLGRYYDLPTQLLMQKLLRRGDRMCDVGANIGMLTLLASRLVGDEGIVESFEPNPDCLSRIEGFIELNGITNVRIHAVGLAEAEGDFVLSSRSVNSGEGTLSPVKNQGTFDLKYDVHVVTGDSVLLPNRKRIALVKIDVEGYESRVLRGLRYTLDRDRPVVVAETNLLFLNRAETSFETLLDDMQQYGYKPYCLGLRRHRMHHTLLLHAYQAGETPSQDIVWLPDRGRLRDRIDQLHPC